MWATSVQAQFTVFNHFFVHSATELRAAVNKVNEIGGVNYIDLAPGVYRLTDNAPYRTEFFIQRGSLIIRGQQSHPAVLNASNTLDRIFEVEKNAKLTLTDVVLTGAWSPVVGVTSTFSADGAAICNRGTLTLLRCAVTDNMTTQGVRGTPAWMRGSRGGAVYSSGTFAANDCTFSGNFSEPIDYATADGEGGAIYNSGTSVLKNRTISGNKAGDGGYAMNPAGNGGGICNVGLMLIDHCNVSFNSCGSGADNAPESQYDGGPGGFGGGIFNSGRSSSTRLRYLGT